MTKYSCPIYGLFITSIFGVLLGAATLALATVFKYIGFIESQFSLATCSQTYLVSKYTFLTHQLEMGYVGICLGVLMNLIVFFMLIITVIKLRGLKSNQNPQQQTMSIDHIHSRAKNGAIYVMLSLGTLGNVVCFGYFLQFYLQAQKDPNTCLFVYFSSNLLILLIIAGVWIASFLVAQGFLIGLRGNYRDEQTQQERRKKYEDKINVTQEQLLQENTSENKYRQFVDQRNNKKHDFITSNTLKQGERYSNNKNSYQNEGYNDNRNNYPNDNRNPYNIPSNNSYQPQQTSPKKQTYLEYKNKQLKQVYEEKRASNPYNSDKKQLYFHKPADENNPKRLSINYLEVEESREPYQSPIRGLDEESKIYGPSSTTNRNNKPFNIAIKEVPYEEETDQRKTPYSNAFMSPDRQQRVLNGSSNPSARQTYRAEQTDRPQEENTRGQLVFYKKAIQRNNQSHNSPSIYQEPSRNEPSRNYSGQVSFKSPSRFDNKFAQQEKDYHSRNTQNSILPSGIGIRQAYGSRKNGFDYKYNSGSQQSNIGGSRGQQYSPSNYSKSRVKNRPGVLADIIRGKFI